MVGFQNLPVEVQGLVFSSLNDQQTNSSVTISRVCRHWQSVVYSTPRAWCNIHVDFDSPHFASRSGWVHFLLSKSKTCLVDVEVTGGHEATPLKLAEARAFNRHLPRIRRLDLHMCQAGDEILLAISGSLEGAAPKLESLTASGHFWRANAAFEKMDADSNILKHVSLSNFIIPVSTKLLKGLTRLELAGSISPLPISRIFRGLQDCPELRELLLEGLSHWGAEGEAALPVVTMPKLCEMTLKLDHLPSILNHIATPQLRKLELSRNFSGGDNVPAADDSIYAFLERSSFPPINELHIDDVGMDDEAWIDCLQALPQLESMTSKDVGFNDAVLEALRVKDGREVLCPRLSSWSTIWNFSISKVMYEFLRSRNPFRPPCSLLDDSRRDPPRVCAIKHLDIAGNRPNDAAITTIKFIMVASDPMSTFTFPTRY